MDLEADFPAVFISENLRYSIASKSFMAFLITLFCTLTDDLRLSLALRRSMLTGAGLAGRASKNVYSTLAVSLRPSLSSIFSFRIRL